MNSFGSSRADLCTVIDPWDPKRVSNASGMDRIEFSMSVRPIRLRTLVRFGKIHQQGSAKFTGKVRKLVGSDSDHNSIMGIFVAAPRKLC